MVRIGLVSFYFVIITVIQLRGGATAFNLFAAIVVAAVVVYLLDPYNYLLVVVDHDLVVNVLEKLREAWSRLEQPGVCIDYLRFQYRFDLTHDVDVLQVDHSEDADIDNTDYEVFLDEEVVLVHVLTNHLAQSVVLAFYHIDRFLEEKVEAVAGATYREAIQLNLVCEGYSVHQNTTLAVHIELVLRQVHAYDGRECLDDLGHTFPCG